MPILPEVKEMLHQWEVAFEVDDARFRSQIGVRPTDPDEGAAQTVTWARQQYGTPS